MAIELNKAGFELAKLLITQGKFNTKQEWHTAEPTTQRKQEFLKKHTIEEYGTWFLAINTVKKAGTEGYYEFPFGDFSTVFRSCIIAIMQRAGQYKHAALETAATQLLTLIDKR